MAQRAFSFESRLYNLRLALPGLTVKLSGSGSSVLSELSHRIDDMDRSQGRSGRLAVSPLLAYNLVDNQELLASQYK